MITDEHVVIPSEPAREPTKAENKEENKAEPVKSLFTAVEALERRMIADALKETGGNKQRAAQNLGLSRQGLLKKLKRLGLPGKQARASDKPCWVGIAALPERGSAFALAVRRTTPHYIGILCPTSGSARRYRRGWTVPISSC